MLTDSLVSIFKGNDLSGCMCLELALGECVVFTTKSPSKGAVDDNEDAVAVVQVTRQTAVLVVADGMGGHANGAEAAWLTVHHLTDRLVKSNPKMLRRAIIGGLTRASRLIQSKYPEAGSTVALTILNGTTVTTCHAGDSETLICNQRGKLKMHTVPHSPVGRARALGLLSERDAMFHDYRHVVSNAVGLPDFALEFGKPRQLHRRDTLLLASDGLYDNLFTHEILSTISSGSLLGAANQLVKKSQERMCCAPSGAPRKPDDLSLVMFRLNGARL